MADSKTKQLLAEVLEAPERILSPVYTAIKETPISVLLLVFLGLSCLSYTALFIFLNIVAPKPRAPYASEKHYITTTSDGKTSSPRPLSCWYDRWLAERKVAEAKADKKDPGQSFVIPNTTSIEPAEVELSVVIPAYNEEERLTIALEEAVEYLDANFGRPEHKSQNGTTSQQNQNDRHDEPSHPRRKRVNSLLAQHRRITPSSLEAQASTSQTTTPRGYEILLVDDGSTDATISTALQFSHKHNLHDILRIIKLSKNRGKGGAIAHGFRHVRGEYAVFADADGASRFSDLSRLIEGCEYVVDGSGRGVAIGSRGHLVGSEAVVKRSALRNLLMRSFHAVIMILTPPATSRIRDTQCGFKLFSRNALPDIVPYMHAEGWIFDIDMLMLAESAPAMPVRATDGTVIGVSPGIRVAEVPIDWHEVGGSKMNLIKDSIMMALGLVVLRGSWMLGVYRRRLT